MEGATVTLSDGLLLSRDLTVPAGVTIDLTSAGRFHMRNATLTVNGTVNAGAGHVNLEDNSEALVYVGLGGQMEYGTTARNSAASLLRTVYASPPVGGSGYETAGTLGGIKKLFL